MIDEKSLMTGFGETIREKAADATNPGIYDPLTGFLPSLVGPTLRRFGYSSGQGLAQGTADKTKDIFSNLPWGKIGLGAGAIGIPLLMMGMMGRKKQPQQAPININLGMGGMPQQRPMSFPKPGITG